MNATQAVPADEAAPTSLTFGLLLVYLTILFLRPQEFVEVLQDVPLVRASLLLAFGAWLVAQPKDFEAPQHALMPMLALAIGGSVVAAGWLTGGVEAVVDFAPTLMLFYVVATTVDTLERFRRVALLLTVLCVVIAVHGFLQYASEDGVGFTGAAMIQGRITYTGQLNDPNDLSMVLLMVVPLALFVGRHAGGWLLRRVAPLAAVALLVAVYLCNSRGAVLAAAAMLLVGAVRRYGLGWAALLAPALGGGLMMLAPSRVADMSADEASAAGRVEAWYAGLEMLREHPIFGVGKGMFIDHHDLTAHNSFVLAFAELGFAGYAVWIAILLTTGVMLRQALDPDADPAPPDGVAASGTAADDEHDWAVYVDAAATLWVSFVGTLVCAFFLSRSYVDFLYLLVALVVALHQTGRDRWPDRLEAVRLADLAGPIVAVTLASVGGVWLLTGVLLRL